MKPDLVLIPGFMGQPRDYNRLIAMLAPFVNCHAVCLPEAVAVGKLSFAQAVEHWFLSIRHSLPPSFLLFGYSLGGRLAMAIADYLHRQSPGVLQALLLASANPGIDDENERVSRRDSDRNWANRFRAANNAKSMQFLLHRWYEQSVFNNLEVQQVQQLVDKKKHLKADQLAGQLESFSLARQPDYRVMLSKLPVPVYYFSGRDDKKFTAIGASLAGVDHRIAPTGHIIHFENPHWLASHIALLLNRQHNMLLG